MNRMSANRAFLTRLLLVACFAIPGTAWLSTMGQTQKPAVAPLIVRDEILMTPLSVTAVGRPYLELVVAPENPSDPVSITRAFFKSYKAEYRVQGPEEEFKVSSISKDSGPYAQTGMTHVRVQQVYKQLPVFSSEVVLHLNREMQVVSAAGRTVGTPEVNTTPKLASEAARQLALAKISKEIVPQRQNQSLLRKTVELGIFSPPLFGLHDGAASLAYRIEELGYVTFVDAQEGGILLQYDNINTTKNRETHDTNETNALPGTLVLTEGSVGCALGFDLRSPNDQALPFDYDGDGKQDLFFYRPGSGAAWVDRSKGDGTFPSVYTVGDNGSAPPNGIAGFDLLSPNDQVLAFDYNGDGKQDLFLYRPGSGAAFVARSNGDGTFTAVYAQGAGGSGIAGFDFKSPDDRVLAFDYDGDGKQDLFFYRPGSGAAFVARSNGDGTFTGVFTVGDNGTAPPNGIAGFDLLSANDNVLMFDYNGDGKQDLFLYRAGSGAAWVIRSNGDGTFVRVGP
jgi:hypothetical protein